MRRLAAFILLSLLPAILVAQRSQSGQPKGLAFVHVSVIDATGAPAEPDMTALIVGERIADLGPTTKTRVPANTQVVDATGKYLIPGLWDMHSSRPTGEGRDRWENPWRFP